MPDLTPDEIAELASFLSPRDRAALFSTTSDARAAYAQERPAFVAEVNAVAAELRRQLAECREASAELQEEVEEFDDYHDGAMEMLRDRLHEEEELKEMVRDRLREALDRMATAQRRRPRDLEAESDEWHRLVREIYDST
jgi:hypothetical protein